MPGFCFLINFEYLALMKIKGYRQFKYTKNLWRDWFDYSINSGKYRKYIRLFIAIPLLGFDVFRAYLTIITILIDLYRLYRTVILFYNHFERHWKPYVLQRYIEY